MNYDDAVAIVVAAWGARSANGGRDMWIRSATARRALEAVIQHDLPPARNGYTPEEWTTWARILREIADALESPPKIEPEPTIGERIAEEFTPKPCTTLRCQLAEAIDAAIAEGKGQ